MRNRKQKEKLIVFLVSGGGVLFSILLAAITIPKTEKLKELRKEWEEIEPLLAKADELLGMSNSEDSSPLALDHDPRFLVPEKDDALDFLNMVLHKTLESGMGDIPQYRVDPAASWPPTIGSNKEDIIPENFSEPFDPPHEGTKIRRHPIQLNFRCRYPSLLKFCEELQKIPRYAQISSVSMEGNFKQVTVEIWVEAYSLNR